MRLRADAAEIERGLYLLVEEGATFEIRAIATRRGGGGEDILSGTSAMSGPLPRWSHGPITTA